MAKTPNTIYCHKGNQGKSMLRETQYCTLGKIKEVDVTILKCTKIGIMNLVFGTHAGTPTNSPTLQPPVAARRSAAAHSKKMGSKQQGVMLVGWCGCGVCVW